MQSPAAAMAKDFDNLIARSREALPFADAISAAPAQLRELQVELDRLGAQVTSARTALAAERAAWQIEWKSLRDASDLSAVQRQQEKEKLLAKLDEATSELRAVQNKCAATTAKLEKIAKVMGRIERMLAQPTAGAPGMNAAVAELRELVRG